jgi:putative transposase
MVTTSTWGQRELFRNERWAKLLIDTLRHYRGSAYLLHEYVIMPDHVHALIPPLTSLEKSVQFIKGGFSYRAKRELNSNMEVWQKGFSDRRIRDADDYRLHAIYMRENPVRKRLCERAEEYPYSSRLKVQFFKTNIQLGSQRFPNQLTRLPNTCHAALTSRKF